MMYIKTIKYCYFNCICFDLLIHLVIRIIFIEYKRRLLVKQLNNAHKLSPNTAPINTLLKQAILCTDCSFDSNDNDNASVLSDLSKTNNYN